MGDIYEAEDILKQRKRKGITEYLIKWKHFEDDCNTWEPDDNIIDKELISSFKESIKKKKKKVKLVNCENSFEINNVTSSEHEQEADPVFDADDSDKDRNEREADPFFDADDSDKDPNYEANASSSSSDEEIAPIVNKPNRNVTRNLKSCNTSDTTQELKSIHVNVSNLVNTEQNRIQDTFISENLNLSSEIKITDIFKANCGKSKQHFCSFCQKLVTKYARHLDNMHKEELEVKEILMLPKGSTERKRKIDYIRKQSDFKYNTTKGYNTGQLIITRRPNEKYERTKNDFKVCPSCKGFYSKRTLRLHYVKCDANSKKGDRSLSVSSKIVHAQLHKKANFTLRNKIFPPLRCDDTTDIIRYDELVIIYGNHMSNKYRKPHLHKMIRSKLRLIGRLLLEVKKINHAIDDFASIFNPLYYDSIIEAINNACFLNHDSMVYKSPATAFAYGTLLKKCGKILINEYIKKNEEEKQKLVRNFLSIMDEDYACSINKTVEENQQERRRQKKQILPSMNDIKCLHEYLTTERTKYYKLLKTKYDVGTWINLAKVTLTSIQVFNRRRAGEIERLTIDDFSSYQSVEDNSDYASYLADKAQETSKKYVRFLIRGKKGRNVPTLIDEDMKSCLKLILEYRENSGVPKNNPYVFGIVGSNSYCHLDACALLREFSKKCNATMPSSLRGTELRKQIATFSLINDIEEKQVTDLCAHLGHERKIHEEHYRMPVASRDITRMSRLLEKAQGIDNYLGVQNQDDLNCNSSDIQARGSISDTEIFINDDDNNMPMSTTISKKTRSVSPVGYVKRVSWGEAEKECALKYFKNNIETGQLPTMEQLANVIGNNSELSTRNELQLKAWVSNQIINRKKDPHKKRNKGTVQYWSKEEVAVLKTCFAKNLRNGDLPSFSECQECINQHSELFINRNKATVKAWINNYIRKHKYR